MAGEPIADLIAACVDKPDDPSVRYALADACLCQGASDLFVAALRSHGYWVVQGQELRWKIKSDDLQGDCAIFIGPIESKIVCGKCKSANSTIYRYGAKWLHWTCGPTLMFSDLKSFGAWEYPVTIMYSGAPVSIASPWRSSSVG